MLETTAAESLRVLSSIYLKAAAAGGISAPDTTTTTTTHDPALPFKYLFIISHVRLVICVMCMYFQEAYTIPLP